MVGEENDLDRFTDSGCLVEGSGGKFLASGENGGEKSQATQRDGRECRVQPHDY